MRVMFEYKCETCGYQCESLRKRDEAGPLCPTDNIEMKRLISTPAFTFTNGKGTDGGQTMRIAGRPVPGGSGGGL